MPPTVTLNLAPPLPLPLTRWRAHRAGSLAQPAHPRRRRARVRLHLLVSPCISPDLPISPHISRPSTPSSKGRPTSPHISPYLPISPHISPYLPALDAVEQGSASPNPNSNPNQNPNPNPNPSPSPNPSPNPSPSPNPKPSPSRNPAQVRHDQGRLQPLRPRGGRRGGPPQARHPNPNPNPGPDPSPPQARHPNPNPNPDPTLTLTLTRTLTLH